MNFLRTTLLLATAWSIVTADDGVIKRKFAFSKPMSDAIQNAAARVKRGAFAAAMAPQVAGAAGDVLKNIGSKLVDGAVSVLSAGANHVKEAEQKAAQHEKEAAAGAASAQNKAGAYDKATLSLMPSKGELSFGDTVAISPPGYKVSAKFGRPSKPEKDGGDKNQFVAYPMGLGMAMMNGCYGTNYQPGDPCYAIATKMTTELCENMLDAAAFIGVGFDGRGDYSSEYRKKSVVQRMCAARKSFNGKKVPDTMNVHGVYDTEVEQTTFTSSEKFQKYLETKGAVSSYKYSFSEALRKTYGMSAKVKGGGVKSLFGGGGPSMSASTSGSLNKESAKKTSTQAASEATGKIRKEQVSTFMSMLEVNIIRYEIFMDEVVPKDLKPAFLEDFLKLPTSYFSARAPIKYQNFILRWGTHYVKSAKFGGHLRLTRTKTIKGQASAEAFAETANSDMQALFSNSASSHTGKFKAKAKIKPFSGFKGSVSYNTDSSFASMSNAYGNSESSSSAESEQAVQQNTYSTEYMLVEGGSQEIASILSDFYSPSFKDNFLSWLESVPEYPKPFEFTLGTLSGLLDMNVMDQFKEQDDSVKIGCENAKFDVMKRKWYYDVTIRHIDNSTTSRKRYCELGRSSIELQKNFDMRKRSLTQAITIYMEEGPIPAYDLFLKAGTEGCETRNLLSITNRDNALVPKWSDISGGQHFKVLFDAPQDIPGIALANDLLYVAFGNGQWYNRKPGEHMHLFNGFNNGGTGNLGNKKISVSGLVMTYDEQFGVFTVTPGDYNVSLSALPHLPLWLSGLHIARAEYLHPIEQVKAQKGFGFSINPCNVKFSNAHKFNPTVRGGRCIKFAAASEGDIFVVFAAIPREHGTWYHLQVSPSGVALYKGMQMVTRDTSLEARGLGDKALYQTYFVCIMDKGKDVTIQYGTAQENSLVIFMTWKDRVSPLHVEYYAFGSGDKEVNIMDIHVISQKDMGYLQCKEKMVEGECVQDCHEQCIGCSTKRSDLACNKCKNYTNPLETGTQCVASCPPDRYLDQNTNKCLCNLALLNKPYICLSSCPTGTIAEDKFCKPNPCSDTNICNNGECNLVHCTTSCAPNLPVKYTCTCPHGYSGENCEINVCGTLMCQNGGQCVKNGTSYSCSCKAGFTGDTCQTNIDECLGNSCQNGKCIDGINSYKCQCDPNYSGTYCDIDMARCRTHPCKNGAVCTNGQNTYTCHCQEHFQGTHCTDEIAMCRSNPCKNGAVCTNGKNTFNCTCSGNFKGLLCTDLDGGWSDYIRSGPCSRTCDTGQQKYVRSCTNPFRQGAGQDCTGSKEKYESCIVRGCKYNFGHSVKNRSYLDSWSNYIIISDGSTLLYSGTLKRWKYYARRTGTMYLLVFRKRGNLSYIKGLTRIVVRKTGADGYNTNIAVKKGDYIGVWFSKSVMIPYDGKYCTTNKMRYVKNPASDGIRIDGNYRFTSDNLGSKPCRQYSLQAEIQK